MNDGLDEARHAADHAITGGGMVAQAASHLDLLADDAVLHYFDEDFGPIEIRVADIRDFNEGLVADLAEFQDRTGFRRTSAIVTSAPDGGTRYRLAYDAANNFWRLTQIAAPAPRPAQPAVPPARPDTSVTRLLDDLRGFPPRRQAETLNQVFAAQLGYLLEFHEALVSGIELAAEQVQDKRLEWQETSEPIDIRDHALSLFFEFALDFAIGRAGGYLLRYGRRAVPGLARGGAAFMGWYAGTVQTYTRRQEDRLHRYRQALDGAKIGEYVNFKALRTGSPTAQQRAAAVIARYQKGKERKLTQEWLRYLDEKRYVSPVKKGVKFWFETTAARKTAPGKPLPISPFDLAKKLKEGKFPSDDDTDVEYQRAPDTPGVMLRRIARDYLSRTRRVVEQWRADFGWALLSAIDQLLRDPKGDVEGELRRAGAVIESIAEAIDEIEEDFEAFRKANQRHVGTDAITQAALLKFEEAIWALHYAGRLKVKTYYRGKPTDDDALEIEGAHSRAFTYWKTRFFDEKGKPLRSDHQVMVRFQAIKKQLGDLAKGYGFEPDETLMTLTEKVVGDEPSEPPVPDAPPPVPTN